MYRGRLHEPDACTLTDGDSVSYTHLKPVALMEYLIRTYTDEGDVVLDNCIGSGTTAVAAIRTGRHYICLLYTSRCV